LVLISKTEGWPKAVAEAMAFGVCCIGASEGFVPSMLAEGRGFTVPAGDSSALLSLLRELHGDSHRRVDTGNRAAEWARQYTLEGLRQALFVLLEKWWGAMPTIGRLQQAVDQV
jgi:glycosyltransferase involved in cell wall biosynthesis